MLVKRKEDLQSLPVENCINTEITWLISRKDGAQNFEMRKFTLKKGGKMPKHYHDTIEHEQYVLKGSYIVGLDDKVYRVKEGDVIFIPQKVIHWYKNDTDEDAEFICIIPKVESYKTVYIEE